MFHVPGFIDAHFIFCLCYIVTLFVIVVLHCTKLRHSRVTCTWMRLRSE